MRKVLFATLLAGVVVCACTEKNSSDQSLQITKKDIVHLEGTFNDNFLDSWEYIVLDDDNPNAIMADINGIFYDDSLIFILSGKYSDQPQIKVFDGNGKYLYDIGHVGRARHEYLHICDWAINVDRKEIMVFDNFAFVLKRYDYDGEYLGQSPMPSIDFENGFIGGDFVKSLSDGTIMYQGGLAIIPTLDYYYIKPDGTCHSPLQKTGYHSYCDMDPYEFIEIAGDIGFIGTPIYHSNLLSDTAYLLRVLDNHIYKASADSVQCLANMTFIPEVPEKTKLNFDYEAEEKYFGRSIPNYMYDMKDYLYMWYYHGGEYLFEKTTSKVYHISHDSLHVSLPEISSIAIFDNTIIGCVSDYALNDALERMESKDYDHRYSPDVEAFYRKARRCENPPIIIAHYKSKK